MPIIKNAVIAAAGLGSRLGHGKPKCLVEVAGKPILEWQLRLLDDVEDVRIVVGYMEQDVVKLALSLRSDVIIVRNPAFRSTTTQQSYWLGGRYLKSPCLYLDGDIIFHPESFKAFLDRAGMVAPLIGIASSKTEQAVFVETIVDPAGNLSVTGFSRNNKTPWEWANIACLPPGILQENGGDVFSRLAGFTPLDAQNVECFEFDTDADLIQAEAFGKKISSRI